ncbi:MAG: Apolipoprotein N-acyltransferase [Myxococcota bacterium]|nr:Apolipoprotein N-acyltransferase [Myxococcota bacterium]
MSGMRAGAGGKLFHLLLMTTPPGDGPGAAGVRTDNGSPAGSGDENQPRTPWTRRFLWGFCIPVLAGLLTAAAHPLVLPFLSEKEILPGGELSLFAWIGLVPLLVLARGQGFWPVFRAGWYFGWAYFGLSLYWIHYAMFMFGHIPWIPSLLILILLVVYCALYIAFPVAIAERMRALFGWPLYWTLPWLWLLAEHIRHYAIGGFPWAMLGYTQFRDLWLVQTADLAGPYGITFLLAAANAVLTHVWLRLRGLKEPRNPWTALGVLVLVTAAGHVYGYLRMAQKDELMNRAPGYKVAVLQGNISQEVKNQSGRFRERILEIYNEMTRKADSLGADVLVWPEAAFPLPAPQDISSFRGTGLYGGELNVDLANQNDPHPKRLKTKKMILGVPTYFRMEEFEDGKPKSTVRLRNTALLLDDSLEVKGRYHKSHLVPFGEYVPGGAILTKYFGIQKLVQAVAFFVPGDSMEPFDLEGQKTGILICYEGIFPEISREQANNGATILTNMSNDGWYGLSSGPYQHMGMYVFRAVETARPMVRAANTGISTFIDANGRIGPRTSLKNESTTWQEGEILFQEIKPLRITTFYMATGDAFLYFANVVAILQILWWAARRKTK